MTTTYEELYRKVVMRIPVDKSQEGRRLLAVKESINDAHKMLARVKDFDELITVETGAATVDGQKTYQLDGAEFNLTRPKDVYSIRLIDDANSHRLRWVPPNKLDNVIANPESNTESRPYYYTRRGNNIELIPIPDTAYTLYIHYSQWPSELTADSDTTDFEDLDDVIIGLATEMALGVINGVSGDWRNRAIQYLTGAVAEDNHRPDEKRFAEPFRVGFPYTGEAWKDPSQRRDDRWVYYTK